MRNLQKVPAALRIRSKPSVAPAALASGAGADWPEVPQELRRTARGSLLVLTTKLGINEKTTAGWRELFPLDADAERDDAPLIAGNLAGNARSFLFSALQIVKGQGSAGDRLQFALRKIVTGLAHYMASIAWGRAPIDQGPMILDLTDSIIAVWGLLPAALSEAEARGAAEGYALGMADQTAWITAGAAGVRTVFDAWSKGVVRIVKAPAEIVEHGYDKMMEEFSKGQKALKDMIADTIAAVIEWAKGAAKIAGGALAVFAVMALGLLGLSAYRRK